ncbi:MAG: efflux RND transporter permease subunit [Candidatus Omnitrophica bacterium]|nr:efflux RND transporter permease subunit [Candidatus Omnitrophota bacterium]
MSLPRFAIQQRVTTVMVAAGIVFLGTISAFSIQKELFPQLTFPQVTVITDYTNAAPEEIETLITRPLEEAISATSGLRELKSTSQEGKSTIFASFGWNENIDFAALSVREKIDLIKERLPKEAADPVVLKFDPLARPIMILSVSGKLSAVELKTMSEQILKENLEKVEGVASATVSGGLDREIQVELDQGRLQSTQVSILDVIDSIDQANISYPAGSIKKGLYEYLIRTVGEFRSVPEIGYTVIKTDVKKEFQRQPESFMERGSKEIRDTIDTLREGEGRQVREGRLVMVRDIGSVKDSFHERTSISRYNGKENISIAIQRQGSANTVKVVDRVKHELRFLEEDLAARGITAEIIYDHSVFIRNSVASVRNAGIAGALIAVFCLFPFFKNWLSSLTVSVVIPISVIGTFFIFQLQGITLNAMSLGGLAIGIGMMVDNCIVVIENIFRHQELGESPVEAAVNGTNEVLWPVVSSTLTTIAVFMPMILFIPGVAGQLFKDFSWAVIHSSNFSLLVSLTVVPMMATYVQKSKQEVSKFKAYVDRKKEKIKNYFAQLNETQQNQVFLKIIGGGFLCFLLSLFILRSLDTEVLPKVDQGQFLIHVNLPVGSRLDATDEIVSVIENEARAIKEVKDVTVTIGSSSSTKAGEAKVETLRPYQAIILVALQEKRRHSSFQVVSDLRRKLESYEIQKAQIEFVVQESEFSFAQAGGKPIVVEIKGYDLEKLSALTRQIQKIASSIPGVTEIINDIGEPSPETKVEIDRRKAALYAISARDISLTAKASVEGAVATTFKEAGREIDVRVRLEEKDRKDLTHIGDMLVYSNALEVPVPLKEVGTIKQGYGPSEIRRKDQIRTVTVTAAIEKGFKEKNVIQKLTRGLDHLEIPKDYTVDLTGKAKEVRESFMRISFAVALILILNYMIMAAQFESFLHPFVIIFTVPLSLIGVAFALFVTHTPVSIIALLGVLILSGSAVNNPIVLIDFLNGLRRQGIELVEASIEATFVRFRPIVMSTLTGVVSSIPLALGIGEGAQLQAPLAIAMIGGLLSATFFTLCVIPSLYILATRMIDRLFGEPDFEEETTLE